jgi:acetyltransferase-like isoleucine patch superfamily enzyme
MKTDFVYNSILYKLRWLRYKYKLKYLGKNVRIEKGVIVKNCKRVSIDDNSWIDNYTILEGGNCIEIGKNVHIVSFCHLQGGCKLIISDNATIASGCKIFSDSNYYTKRMSSATRLDEQEIRSAPVIIEKDAFIGLNSVVLPGVKIGEGSVIGANSLVIKDIPPWSIAVGSPAIIIKERPKLPIP